MYDPVHGIYHNFYQIHIAEDMNGAGDGPDWGHWVSKDFIHWAQLPVAIWNDKYYDNSAIFTGSATIVNGEPVIMYPGKCRGPGVDGVTCNDGHGGFTYVLTTPANRSDPLYVEWTKEGTIGGKPFSNPVVNNTGDDPSTAWKTKYGEWRIIGNQGCSPEGGNPMYASKDFITWEKVGCTTMMAGDCPSFFPLPGFTPGSEHYVAQHGPLPDHVHKSGGHGGDQTQVGNWVDGEPGSVGTWTITPGSVTQFLDKGSTHASKDFYDPVGKRRIMWVWGTVKSGIQTIPRDMTYHPGLKRVVYSPVKEMDALHTTTLDHTTQRALEGESVALKVSSACDIDLTFDVPTTATKITVDAGAGPFFIDFAPPPAGGDDPWMVEVGFGGRTDALPLLRDDKELSLRIFLDGSVAEGYWMGGRVVLTDNTKPTTSAHISATAAATLSSATVYQMGDIHTTVEEVLAAPRLH